MFFYTKKSFFIHIFFPTKYFDHKKEGQKKSRGKKVGNIGQTRAIGNEGKIGIVRKVPNSFK